MHLVILQAKFRKPERKPSLCYIFRGNFRVIVVISSNFFAVFEEAFSMFDVHATGKIQFKFLFPLLRNLGYNVHKAEAWDYLNELELAGKVTRNSDLTNNNNNNNNNNNITIHR